MTGTALIPAGPMPIAEARRTFAYDIKSGVHTWRSGGRGRRQKGNRAGAVCGRYRQVTVDGVTVREHRLAFAIVMGFWPPSWLYIDHRDHNGCNNAWVNLRPATSTQNARNKRPGRQNTSGVVGVTFDRASGKWEAFIGINKRTVHLGKYRCFDDAAAIRCQAARHHFGSFAADVARYSDAAE